MATPLDGARRLLAFALGLCLVLVSGGALAAPQSARALESRLYAPCCYGGTLDVHDSELAHDLRKEIEARLAQGEASSSIQNDFVGRYGDKILAARSEKPIELMTLGLGAGLLSAAVGMALVLRRWLFQGRNLRATAAAIPTPPQRDDYDGVLDEALAELDS